MMATTPIKGTVTAMRILVVDDEEAVRVSLRRALALDGHVAVLADDGASALRMLRDSPPDAVILDWMLPDIDGVEVCRRLRAAGDDIPVLLLTARTDVRDRVAGLDAGADDFLAKPFDLDELLARVRALLRRAPIRAPNGPDTPSERLVFADLVLDRDSRRARRGTRPFTLSRTEFTLLELFMDHPGVVLGRARILDEVWGYDFGGNSGNLDVYVSYLRRKLEADGEARLVQTVRGVGYVLRQEP